MGGAAVLAGGALRAPRAGPPLDALAGGAVIAAAIQTTLLGLRLRILDPAWLWIAPLGLAAGAFAAWRSWQRAQQVRRLVPQERRALVLPGSGSAQGVLRGSTLGTALVLLFIAAAGPQCGERTEIVKRSGVDLVVALDASTSMLARDVKPSRIERARAEISALLDAKGAMTGYKKDSQGRTVLTRADASMLQDIAAAAGGKLLEGSGGELGILQLVSELEKLQKGELESRLSVQYADRSAQFAWPAFFLLCAAAMLGEGALSLRRRGTT